MRFYGQFDPPVDKVLHDTYLTDVRGGVCIEACAYDGELESCNDGTATFNHAVHPEHGADFCNGSLGHTAEGGPSGPRLHVRDLRGRAVRYDTLLDRHCIGEVHLFVLDVEGHELSVLRGMEGTRRWPRVFCIEHGHIGADNLRQILEPVGYVFDGIADANAYFSLPGVNPWN